MKCRLCDSENMKPYYTQGNKNQFHFYKCTTCGLVNYDLSGGIDQTKYTEVYVDTSDEKQKQNRLQTETYRFIRSRIKTKGRYMDIGCGNGKLLSLLKNDGWKVQGLELSPFYARQIKQRLDIHVTVANFLDFDPEGKQFDLITLRHVLEHIPDSINALTKINRMLAPGGYAVLEFPNIEGAGEKWKRFLMRNGLKKKHYADDYTPGHCNEFCEKAFRYLTAKTNFDLLIWQTYSSKNAINLFYRLFNIGSKVRVLISKKTNKNTQ